MTIDEAIEKYKLLSTKGNIMFPQRPDVAEKSNRDYKQTADWLEELKALRVLFDCSFIVTGQTVEEFEKSVRNNTVDDFMEKIDDDICCDCSKCGNGCRLLELREIAEQLKK